MSGRKRMARQLRNLNAQADALVPESNKSACHDVSMNSGHLDRSAEMHEVDSLTLMDCPECNGKGGGVAPVYWSNGDWGAGVEPYTCSRCNGTGKIPKVEQDESGEMLGCVICGAIILPLILILTLIYEYINSMMR
jgi:hypothetical protein